MNVNLGPTKNLGTHVLPLKTKETNVAEPTLTLRPSSHGSTLRATQCPHFLTVSVSERGKSMEVGFLWVRPSKMAEIYGLSIGGDPNHLPLTNWEVGWLEDHFSLQKNGCLDVP